MPKPLSTEVVQRMLARGGGATLDELRAWGLSMSAIRRLTGEGQLLRSAKARYVLPMGASPDQWQRARSEHLRRAASLVAPDGIACLRTASLIWSLPVFSIPDQPEVRRPPGSRGRAGTRTLRCAVEPAHTTVRNGVAVTSLERTAVDVALALPTPQALITVDAALRRGAEPEVLQSLLSERGPVRGCRRARQTVEWADPRSESPLESLGRGELMMRGVPRPECNVTLRFGSSECRPDDLWWAMGIAGEADGRDKYADANDTLWTEKRRQQIVRPPLDLV
jgi:hypothetical protein